MKERCYTCLMKSQWAARQKPGGRVKKPVRIMSKTKQPDDITPLELVVDCVFLLFVFVLILSPLVFGCYCAMENIRNGVGGGLPWSFSR